MNEIPRHGFSRWNLLPEHDEGSAQFFRRMILCEGEENISYFNALNGLKESSLDPEETLTFLMRHPFSEDVKEHLRNSSTYNVEKNFHAHRSLTRTLRGESFKRGDLVAYRRRWCPACVAEKPYLRLWFDVAAIGECPYHGMSMREGGSIPWYRTSFADLIDFEATYPPRSLRLGSFGHYVLGRLGCEEVLPDDVLDTGTIGDVIDACGLVGVMMRRDWEAVNLGDASPEEVDKGFRLIRRGARELGVALYARMIAQVSPELLNGNVEDIFGWGYARTSNACGALGPWLRGAMRSAIAINRIGRPHSFTSAGMVSLSDLTKRYGLREESLSTFLKEECFVEPDLRRRRPILESQLPEIDTSLQRLVNAEEFANLLGLPRGAHRQLVNAGFARQYRGRIFGRPGPFFRRDDIAAILDRVRTLSRGGDLEYARAFLNTARMARVAPGTMAVEVLTGEVAVCDIKNTDHGFRDLILQTEHRLRRKPRAAEDELIMLTDVISILQIAKTTSRALLKAGHLKPIGTRAGRHLFARTDIESFARLHVCEHPFRKAAGVGPKAFSEAMAGAGVDPIVRFDDKLVHDTIYVRAEVMAALSFDKDPLDFEDTAVDRFWQAVMTRVANQFRNLRLPREFPKTGCWAATAYRPRFARFTFDPALRVMVVEMSPLGKASVFRFDIDDQGSHADLDRLFEVMSATNIEQTTMRSEKARNRRARLVGSSASH